MLCFMGVRDTDENSDDSGVNVFDCFWYLPAHPGYPGLKWLLSLSSSYSYS